MDSTLCNPLDSKHELNSTATFSKARMGFLLDALKLSIGPEDSLLDISWKVSDVIQEGLGWEDFAVFEIDEKASLLRQIAVCGDKRLPNNEVHSPMQIPLGLGVCGYVALSGQGLLVTNVVDEPLYLVDDRLRFSEICVPVLVDGDVVAVLDAESSIMGFFDYSHFKFLMALSNVISHAMTIRVNESLN